MEIVVTLSDIRNFDYYSQANIDGIIVGSNFSSRFNYSFEDMKEAIQKAKEKGVKVYVSVDSFIYEDDLDVVYEYLKIISEIKVDGIYFCDLGLIEIAKSLNIVDLMIYDGGPMITNTLDSEFYLNVGLGVVLSRELNLEELTKILKQDPDKYDVQVFGHIRLSTSKRKFLTNYFKEIGKEYNYLNSETLSLEEEKRNYRLPIVENKYGTQIFSDYVLEMYEELASLSKYIKRAIIDDRFLERSVIYDACLGIARINEENAKFLYEDLKIRHLGLRMSKGYLYEKLNLTKDEEN